MFFVSINNWFDFIRWLHLASLRSIGYMKISISNLYNSGVKTIKKISSTLKIICINNDQISSLENVSATLQKLYINNHQISKIENLPDNLQELYISNNLISKIENLPIGLQKLYINNNSITRIENLPAGLKVLYINNNSISKLENLPSMLKILWIGDNLISKIENLPDTLQELYIRYNPICNLEIIDIMHFFKSNGSEQRVLNVNRDWKLINKQMIWINNMITLISRINSLKRFIRNRYSLNPYHPIGQRLIEKLYCEYNNAE